MADKVVHFEIPTDNLERAQKFYKETFGWSIQSMPGMGYTLVGTTPSNAQGQPTEPGGINGGMLVRQDPIKVPVITINVASIDEAAKKIQKQGGKVVRKRMSVGPMGFAAYFQDTEGNVLGLWENAPAPPAKK
jgi:uncharacterized protein